MKRMLDVRRFLARIHNDEKGGVSLETILIIGAIALPISQQSNRYQVSRASLQFHLRSRSQPRGSGVPEICEESSV